MHWLDIAARERIVVPPSKVFVFPVYKCFHCGDVVTWDENDKRASEKGSFVDEVGGFTCTTGLLHQG